MGVEFAQFCTVTSIHSWLLRSSRTQAIPLHLLEFKYSTSQHFRQ